MGIANIINTSTSSGGGGGEIIRELVNSSDGQGLYFSNTGYIHLANNAAVEFGTSDFSIEFILNQTGEVGSSGGSIYQSATTVNNKFSIENHVSSNVVRLIFFNAVGAASQYDLSYNMAADYNEPTHYVVSCDRSGNAVLYRNGTEVASVSIATSASTNLGDGVTSTAMIGNSGSGYTFLGGLYRFRTWNKALSHDEVDTCFQRADVPFADQYGSETELSTNSYTNSGFAGFSGSATGFTASGSASGNNAWKNQSFTAGKKYRMTFTVTDGESANLEIAFRSSTGGSGSNTGTIVSSTKGNISGNFLQFTETGAYEVILSDLGSAQSIRIYASGDVGAVNISGFSIVQIGVLTDHDLAFANQTQSLMCQDRAGNSDGTMGGTIQQTQPIVQLNSTSARIGTTAATPADGDLEVSGNVGVGGSPQSPAGISRYLYVGSSAEAGIVLDDTASNPWEMFTDAGNLKFNYNNTGNAVTITSAGVVQVGSSGGATHPKLQLVPGTSSGDSMIQFRNTANDGTVAQIKANQTSGSINGLVIGTAEAEHLTISSAGVLGVGNSDPNGAMELSRGGSGTESIISTWSTTDAQHSQLSFKKSGSSTINTRAVTANGEPLGSINAYGVDTNTDQRRAARIEFNQGAASTGSKVAGNIVFKTSSTSANDVTRLTIDSSGLATFSNGIAFSQTNTSATGASATHIGLDHYEEGTWTPRIAGNTSGVKTAGSTNAGKYTRIGNLVTVTGTVSINGSETIAGEVKLTGLPFSSVNTTNYRSAGIIGANSGAVTATSGYTHLRFVVDPNAAHAWIVQVAADNSGYSHTPAVSSAANVALLGIQITYECA